MLGCYLFNTGVDDLEEDFVEQDDSFEQDAHQEMAGRLTDYPAISTPKRVDTRLDQPTELPLPRAQLFEFVLRVANVPSWIRKPKDPHPSSSMNNYDRSNLSIIVSILTKLTCANQASSLRAESCLETSRIPRLRPSWNISVQELLRGYAHQ